MKITGQIEKVIYTKDGWSSVLVKDIPRDELRKAGFPPLKTCVIAAGNIANPVVDCSYEFEGDWVVNKKYGKQFKVEFSEIVNDDYSTTANFLYNGMLKGVGTLTARAIIEKFGADALKIIDKEPARLCEIPGIGAKKAEMIHESYLDTCGYLKVMSLFKGKITKNKCKKIMDTYGSKFEKIIKENPYQLIYDIKGFGFSTVDKLAQSHGIGDNDPRRVKAGIVYSLEQSASDNGDCFVDINDLGKLIQSLIKNIDVPDDVIVEQVIQLQEDNYLACETKDDTVRVFLRYLYKAERSLGEKIALLKENCEPMFDSDEIDRAIERVERDQDIKFEVNQKTAIETSLGEHISIITGGPGTGKTTIINAIAEAARITGTPAYFMAPTGRASRRLEQATGFKAQTVCKFNMVYEGIVIHNSLIVVDETSMMDVETASKMFDIIDPSCSVVLVGDIDQLPPIGPGNFFRDMVSAKIVSMTKLGITHRFSGSLARNAKAINNGSLKLEYDEQFSLIKEKDPKIRQKLILEAYYKELEAVKYDYRKVQIIVPLRQRGDCCVNELNKIIREKLNPLKAGDPEFGAQKFRLHDRVMQTKNDGRLGISNGDCGIVVAIDNYNGIMKVKMDVGGTIEVGSDEINMVLAYAITVHKSQGSEYKTVISAYGTGDYMMLQRNLLYTAVTRAKNKMIVIADWSALYRAVNNIQPIIRNTALIERIRFYE